MAKTYRVISEDAGILDPGGRPFRSLDKALALAAQAAEDCSWKCLTPPAPDNEVHVGRGNFRCGVLSAHGIRVQTAENGVLEEEHDVPQEMFQRCKGAGPRVDWTLEVTVDRGTGYLADGNDTFYFTGPEQTDVSWDRILDDIADGDKIVEATVRPTPFGRYSHLLGYGSDYPMEWKQGQGF